MTNNPENKRVTVRRHSPEFKTKVVLESFQRDTTIEAVKQKYAVSSSQIYAWRDYFKQNIVGLFESMSKGKSKNKKVVKTSLKSIKSLKNQELKDQLTPQVEELAKNSDSSIQKLASKVLQSIQG